MTHPITHTIYICNTGNIILNSNIVYAHACYISNKKKGVPYIYTLFLSHASIKFCWYSFILIPVRWFVVDSSQITNKSFRGIKWERELLFDCWRSSYWGVARASRGRFRVIANAVQPPPPPTPPDGALFRVVLGHFHKMHSMGTRSQVVINIWEVLHGWLWVLTCANIIISISHHKSGRIVQSEWVTESAEWVSCSCRERSQKQLRRENPRRTHARIAYNMMRARSSVYYSMRAACVCRWVDGLMAHFACFKTPLRVARRCAPEWCSSLKFDDLSKT